MGGRGGGGGGGGRAHAANEVLHDRIDRQSREGWPNAEKNAAAAIYQYAQLTTVTPKPKAAAAK